MRRTPILIALILSGFFAAGCGVKKDVHQKALDDLASTKSQLNEAERDLAAANERVAELEAELASAQKSLGEAEETSMAQLEKLGAVKEELEEVRRQREATKQRLAAFRELTNRFRSLVNTGKLEVAFRNGQMVLKLPAGVLFPSARAELSDDGQTALAEVLTILLEFKDRRFVVAGHTDDRPIKTRKFKNNWELSQARALSVVSAMVEAGFDAKNLAAAGYAEFDPVASNETPEGRQLNRRIEIILVPDLTELPNLVPDTEPAEKLARQMLGRGAQQTLCVVGIDGQRHGLGVLFETGSNPLEDNAAGLFYLRSLAAEATRAPRPDLRCALRARRRLERNEEVGIHCVRCTVLHANDANSIDPLDVHSEHGKTAFVSRAFVFFVDEQKPLC